MCVWRGGLACHGTFSASYNRENVGKVYYSECDKMYRQGVAQGPNSGGYVLTISVYDRVYDRVCVTVCVCVCVGGGGVLVPLARRITARMFPSDPDGPSTATYSTSSMRWGENSRGGGEIIPPPRFFPLLFVWGREVGERGEDNLGNVG